MLRIGLTQRVEIIGHRRERRDCLDQAWTQLLMANGYLPVPLPNRTSQVDVLVDHLQLAGVILTGGNDLSHMEEIVNPATERDEFEFALLRHCSDKKLPVLGVCRGMQVLAHASSIPIVEVSNHSGMPHGISSRTGHDLPIRDRDEVNSYHRFAVNETDIKQPWKVVAVSPDGIVEAMTHESLPQTGIMWHPERGTPNPEDLKLIHYHFAS